MSARALQRVVVRMLYDSTFADAVYEDPRRALAEEDLSAEECRWLIEPDRRRWRVDSLRRFRTLQALMDEYPVATAIVVRRSGVPSLAAFFSSPVFHQAIQDRLSLAVEFGSWLMQDPGYISAFAHIEQAIARARRAPPVEAPSGEYCLARGVVSAVTPTGTLAAWSLFRTLLSQHSAGLLAAAVDPSVELPDLELGEAPEGLIVDADYSVGAAALSLVEFLADLQAPQGRAEALALLESLGATATEAPVLLADFVADGLLVRGE